MVENLTLIKTDPKIYIKSKIYSWAVFCNQESYKKQIFPGVNNFP